MLLRKWLMSAPHPLSQYRVSRSAAREEADDTLMYKGAGEEPQELPWSIIRDVNTGNRTAQS
eukprot:2868247-Rhodomonas_salina.2